MTVNIIQKYAMVTGIIGTVIIPDATYAYKLLYSSVDNKSTSSREENLPKNIGSIVFKDLEKNISNDLAGSDYVGNDAVGVFDPYAPREEGKYGPKKILPSQNGVRSRKTGRYLQGYYDGYSAAYLQAYQQMLLRQQHDQSYYPEVSSLSMK